MVICKKKNYDLRPDGVLTCFYCHKEIWQQTPCISWMGSDAEIYLHKQCAIDMMIRIIRDVHELEGLEVGTSK